MPKAHHLLAGLLVTSCLFAFGCEQIDPERQIARAEQSIDQKQYRTALLDLKSVLQHNARNAKARWLLAELYLAIEDGASAEKELDRARSLGVGDAAILPALAQALRLQAKYDKVLLLDTEEPLPPIPAGELSAHKALAHIAKDEAEAASTELRRAKTNAPNSVVVRYAQAELLRMKSSKQQALEELGQLTTDFPDYAAGWSLRGDLLRADQRYEEAEDAYTRAIDLRVAAVNDRVKRALTRVSLGKWGAVESDAKELIQRLPKFFAGHFLTGLVRYQEGDLIAAQEALQQATTLSPDDVLSMFMLASVDAQIGNENRSRHLAERVVANSPGFGSGRKLLAYWRLKDQDGAAAEALIRPLVIARPLDRHAKAQLAASLMQQGKANEAARLFRSIAELEHSSTRERLASSLGLMSSGDYASGIKVLNQLVETDPNDPLISSALVASYIEQQSERQAVEAAKRFLQRNPDDTVAMNLYGNALAAARDRDGAVRAFQEVLRVDPGNPRASLMLARDALNRDALSSALQLVDAGLSKEPDNLSLLMLRAALSNETGDTSLHAEMLENAVRIAPDQPVPHVKLANLYLEKGQAEKALELLGNDAWDSNVAVLLGRATALRMLDRVREARPYLERVVRAVPDSVDIRFALLEVYQQLGDRGNVSRMADEILELDPDNVIATIVKARLALANGDARQARSLLLEVEEESTSDPAGLLAWMVIAQRDGDYAQEAVYAKRLVELQPSPLHTVMYSRALLRAGVPKQAQNELRSWLSLHPGDASVRMELSNQYLARDEIQSAIDELRKLLKSDPDHVAALNNIAWHLRVAAPREALQHAKRALDAAPESTDIMDTLAMVFAANGDFTSASRYINKAIDGDSTEPTYRFHKAKIMQMSGDVDGAVSEFQAILRGSPPENLRKEAENALATLTSESVR